MVAHINTNHATIALSVEQLLAKARELTGISIIDHGAVEPLTVMCQSINTEGALTPQGAIDIQAFIMRSLVNRLRMFRDFAAHPEIAEQTIKAPIVVCGTTRTGSTKTQKLLAASGDFNWLPFWQSLNPALISGDRNEDPTPRITDTNNFIDWHQTRSPEMNSIHVLAAHEPEEETFTLVHSLRSPVIMGMVEAPSYIQWLMSQDMTPQFEFLNDALKYLQWQGLADPSKRWLLKSPFYAGLEPLLLKVFPDAKLVMTHRPPIQTMPSTCSLFSSFRQPYTDANINATNVVAGSAYTMNMHLAMRQQHPEVKLLDINYSTLVQSVAAVAEHVYRHCDEPLSAASRQRIIDWDNSNPKNKKGAHKYSLEEFGLSEAMVNELYSDYNTFLDATFGAK